MFPLDVTSLSRFRASFVFASISFETPCVEHPISQASIFGGVCGQSAWSFGFESLVQIFIDVELRIKTNEYQRTTTYCRLSTNHEMWHAEKPSRGSVDQTYPKRIPTYFTMSPQDLTKLLGAPNYKYERDRQRTRGMSPTETNVSTSIVTIARVPFL